MAGATPAVEAGFSAARYRVAYAGREVELAIGNRCPGVLARWLRACGHPVGWIITAHNPGAIQRPAAINRARHRWLLAAITRRGTPWLATRALDPARTWPAEAGLLLANASPAMLGLLARRFGQLAIVRVAAGGRSRLVWINPG